MKNRYKKKNELQRNSTQEKPNIPCPSTPSRSFRFQQKQQNNNAISSKSFFGQQKRFHRSPERCNRITRLRNSRVYYSKRCRPFHPPKRRLFPLFLALQSQSENHRRKKISHR